MKSSTYCHSSLSTLSSLSFSPRAGALWAGLRLVKLRHDSSTRLIAFFQLAIIWRDVTLFFFLNNFAGQSALLDAVMRFFYVASAPLAATLWLAVLFFRRETRVVFDGCNRVESNAVESDRVESNPTAARLFEYSSRRAVVAATVFALAICAALWLAFSWFMHSVLQTPILSPRPFASHWVNLLVVEPNDNSFPSPEAILLGVLWIASWALSPRANFAAFALAISGCVARVFCGTHYLADVVVGLCVGAAVCAISMALFGVVLRLSPKPFRQRAWRLRVQGATGFAGVLAVLIFGIATLRQTPRLFAAWQERHSSTQLAVSPNTLRDNTLRDIEYSNRKSLHEGEGATNEKRNNAISSSEENTDAHGKTIPRVGVITTGGFLPREETRLLRALQRLKLAHALVSVDVASLRDNVSREEKDDKDFAMHFASVRFQVRPSEANERRRVAQTAQRIVQTAFATDSALQSVDVVGVVLNHPQRDKVRLPVFAVGAIPVWTASVQRKDLVSKKFASQLNAPNADAGLWLRARSRLYINERVLPRNVVKVSGAPTLFIETSSTRSTPKAATKSFAPPMVPSSKLTPKIIAQQAKTQAPKPSVPETQAAKVAPRAATSRLSPAPKIQTPKLSKPKLSLPQTLIEKSKRTSSTRTKPKTPQQLKLDAQNRARWQARFSNAKLAAKRNEKPQNLQQPNASTAFRARGER